MAVLLSSLVCFFVDELFVGEKPVEEKPKEAEPAKETAAGEFHGKKTKLVAKTGGPNVYQWTILEKLGIPTEEIPNFVVSL